MRLRAADLPPADGEAVHTLKTAMSWMSHLLETNAPGIEDVRILLNWFGECRISRTDHDSSFHDGFSNPLGFAGSSLLSLRSKFGYPFGIDRQPWASAVGHSSKATELNNAEMDALIDLAPRLGSDHLPYPDGLRMEPQAKGARHDAFMRFLDTQENKNDIHLIYTRYFVGAEGIGGGKPNPLPYLAFAYKTKTNPQTIVNLVAIDASRVEH